MHGKGTFIDPISDDGSSIRLEKFKGFYKIIRESGHTPSIANIDLQEFPAWTRATICPSSFRATSTCLSACFTPMMTRPCSCASSFPNLKGTEPNISSNSIYSLVKEQTQYNVVYTFSEVVAVLPGPRLVELFGLADPKPLVLLKERHFDKDDKVLIYSKECINNLSAVRLSVLRRGERFRANNLAYR